MADGSGADRYGGDVLAGDWRRARIVPTVEAVGDLVAEDPRTGFCGAVVGCVKDTVTLEDAAGGRRVFPLAPGSFLIDGEAVTLVRPASPPAGHRRTLTASGSLAVPGAAPRIARAARIYVEGVHDAALLERVWGDDLRIEGVVVQPLHGLDDLSAVVTAFRPAPTRRLGVLVDHLVPGSKEARIVAQVRHADVLVTGHPYVDIWQAVRPTALGIRQWPDVPRDQSWKAGVARALGVSDARELWRRVLGSVDSYTDLETPLLRAVEQLIDFVTAP